MRDHPYDYRGYRCYYRIHSARRSVLPTIVCLGGALQSVQSWQRGAELFSQYMTVLALDPPGMGTAPPLPARFGADFLTDAIAAVLDELRIDRVSVIGASYGALLAYRFAQRFPERMERLVLGGLMCAMLDNWRDRAERHLDSLRQQRLGDFATEVIQELICQRPEAHIYRRRAVERVLRSQLEHLTSEQVGQYIANVQRLLVHPPLDISTPPRVRSLLFTGEYDSFTTPGRVWRLAATFDDAVFTTIRNADHLCILERFDTLAELVLRFLQDACLDGIDGCNQMQESRPLTHPKPVTPPPPIVR